MEEIEKRALRDEIKKSTNSIKMLNAVDSDSESDSDEMEKINWNRENIQEDIVYDQIRNNIDYSEDYIPWRSETEELYFKPYTATSTQYDEDLKKSVHEYLSDYNTNAVDGLSYKNRFDVKANITHKLKGEEGDIDEGIIGGGVGVDFEDKKGELTDYFDPKKTWFSLQDVMELTLLHAQQMETLNEDYNKQIDELNKQLADARATIEATKKDEPVKDNSKEKEAFRKIAELQEILRKKNIEIKMLQEENDYYRTNAERKEHIPRSEESSARPRVQKDIIVEKMNVPRRIRKYSFFNRLETFESERARHHDRLLQEQVEKYLRDFEYRLSHEQRLSKPNPEYEEMLNKWKKSSQSKIIFLLFIFLFY